MKNLYTEISTYLSDKVGEETEWDQEKLIIGLRFKVTLRVFIPVEVQVRTAIFYFSKPSKLGRWV